MKGKIIVVLTLMALFANECNSSAIPMWEFLSRDEKVRVQKAFKKVLNFQFKKNTKKSQEKVFLSRRRKKVSNCKLNSIFVAAVETRLI